MTSLKISTLIVILVVLYSTALFAAEKPNVLPVMADDMGWTDLGSYGSEIDTPNIDFLAKRGVHRLAPCS